MSGSDKANPLPVQTRLNLNAIRTTLLGFEASKANTGEHVDTRLMQLVAAYALLDEIVAGGRDLLSHGSSRAILELNHTVLYGNDSEYKKNFWRAMDASEYRFYNGDESATVHGVTGGIAALMQWCDTHRKLDCYERAAGIIIRTLASPQLFMEGNHRTSVLLASFELLCADKPPLVFSAEHAPHLLSCMKPIAQLTRGSLSCWIQERRLRGKLGQIIEHAANHEHVHQCANSLR